MVGKQQIFKFLFLLHFMMAAFAAISALCGIPFGRLGRIICMRRDSLNDNFMKKCSDLESIKALKQAMTLGSDYVEFIGTDCVKIRNSVGLTAHYKTNYNTEKANAFKALIGRSNCEPSQLDAEILELEKELDNECKNPRIATKQMKFCTTLSGKMKKKNTLPLLLQNDKMKKLIAAAKDKKNNKVGPMLQTIVEVSEESSFRLT